jgi:CxxC motif-containing protein
MTREVICIMCPLGCSMKAEVAGQEVTDVQGNRCKKGIKHAKREVFFPGRILTTTVRTNLRDVPLLPVRSNKEIPKSQLLACVAEISKHLVNGPVKIGQTVIKDIMNLDVDIIACRTIPHSYR